MEHLNRNIPGAIQILSTTAEQITVENTSILDSIFLHEDVRNLPVLVFSISGKTRGGKSLLLNLMVKYLNSKTNLQDNNWLTGRIPDVFTWRGGLDCVTKGVWICPKIYRLKCSDNTEVGILLLDNQGMFDGEITDGENIIISGLSLVISYLQMFNVKDKITTDYLENTIRILVKGVEEMTQDSLKDSLEYKLMFVVRDWIGFDKYGFGLTNGNEYIKKESERGSKENQMLWKEMHKTFEDVNCLLLPHPGNAVSTSEFSQTGELSLLNAEFLSEVKLYIEHIFKQENLILPGMITTGGHIHQVLLSVDQKNVDDSLSFLNVFTEHINYTKVESLKKEFGNLMSFCSDDLFPIQFTMKSILDHAEVSLKGKSAPLYLAQLRKNLEDEMNLKVFSVLLKYYSNMTKPFVTQTHFQCWEDVKSKLNQYLCGNLETVQMTLQNFAQKAAEYYYEELQKEIKNGFTERSQCNGVESQGQLFIRAKNDFRECSDFGCLAGDNACVHPIWLCKKQKLESDLRHVLIQRIHMLTGETVENLKGLIKKQYEFFENLTLLHKNEEHWDTIDTKKDRALMLKKIGFALYGVPQVRLNAASTTRIDVSRMLWSFVSGSGTTNVPNECTVYSTSQLNSMIPIADKISALSKYGNVQFSCVFVTFKSVSAPLFKVKISNSKILFIDSNCRVYDGFGDFKNNNSLPDVVYCYPENCCYNKAQGFSVSFNMSPASKRSSKVIKKADTAGKVVSGVSGIAAAAALTAPLAGIALAPAVGIVGIVGGGIAGIYGLSRGIAKIFDKKKHEEKVTGKDILNLSTNVLSAVSIGALGAFERVAVVAGRVAQGISSLNGVIVLCSSDDTPSLILLLNEIEGDALKILFYFNASTVLDAYQIIREGLKMEPLSRTDKILENLVETNSIQSTIYHGGAIKIENYISQGMADLVITLLKSVNTEMRDLFLKVAYIRGAYQNFQNEMISVHDFAAELISIMIFLNQSIKEENDHISKKVFELFEKSNDREVFSAFITELVSAKNSRLAQVLRNSVFSITSRIKKANNFFNNMEHKGVTLQSYDIEAHLQKEIKNKIKAMIDQQISTGFNLSMKGGKTLDIILTKVLELVPRAESGWTSCQFSQHLHNFTETLVKTFDEELEKCVNIASRNKDMNCSDLDKVFMEVGLDGNYGTSLLNKALNVFQPGQKFQETNFDHLIILPAWSGLIDRLYCYSSSYLAESSKIKLIKPLMNINKYNYDITYHVISENENISVFKPLVDNFPAFVIFSMVDRVDYESGFIWQDK